MSDNVGVEAQTGGRLLVLPSEIRLLIYELVLPPCRIDLYGAATGFRSGGDTDNRHPALLATCRTIHDEAKPVLYENTEFYVQSKYTPDFAIEDAQDYKFPAAIIAATPLCQEMRKLSLDIALTDDDMWVDFEDRDGWYRRLTCELVFLLVAPHLKQVHVELSAPYGPAIAMELKPTINVLNQVMRRVTPTTSIGSSLGRTDFEPSIYFDLISKLKWVDTTHHIYTTKLAGLANESSRIYREYQSSSTSIETKDAEYRAMVYNYNFHGGDAFLREQALSIDREIQFKVGQNSLLLDKLGELATEAASVKEDLKWVEAGRPAYAEEAVAGTEEVPIAVD